MRARLDEQDGAPRPADAPDRSHTADRPVAMPAQILRLQRHAGNRAVASLLRPRPLAVQRDIGWPEATGWNKDEIRTIDPPDAPTKPHKMQRVALAGLPVGNKAESLNPEKTGEKAGDASGGRAIVWFHPEIDTSRAVEIVVHLHGLTSRTADPFAGWRENNDNPDTEESDDAQLQEAEWWFVPSELKKKKERKELTKAQERDLKRITRTMPNPLAGKVRDVERDRIGEQLEASAGSNKQMLAVLPQGTGGANFGDLNLDAYVTEVLRRLASEPKVKAKAPKLTGVPKSFGIVLSAHSAGGRTVANVLGGGKSKHLTGLMLFDALNFDKEDPDPRNNSAQRQALLTWITANCKKLATVLTAPEPSGWVRAQMDAYVKQAAINALPGMRGYFEGMYSKTYDKLNEDMAKRVKDAGIPARYLVAVTAKFHVTQATVKHDKLIGRAGTFERTKPDGSKETSPVAPFEDALNQRGDFVAPPVEEPDPATAPPAPARPGRRRQPAGSGP